MAPQRRFTVEILGDAKGAKGAVKETESALGHLSVQGRLASGGLRVIGTGLKGLGVAAGGFAVAGTAAMIGFGKSVIKTGIDYQNQLNTMQAVSHATAGQMAQISKTAVALGNDLSLPATSAADAAQAMTELAKGGLSAQEAMQAAKGTLQLAAAAQVDGATAATTQANALNSFALKASEAGRVADALANTANAATGDISDFALGLQQSGAVAHQFGVSLNDTLTALGLFANAGIRGQDAGTSLKQALLSLASPSKQAAKALETLNVHAYDARGQFEGLRPLAEQLAEAHKHLSQQAFNAAVSTAFGSDAARVAGVLAQQGAAGFDKMSTAVGQAGGAAQVAAARMKGVGGAIQGLQSQFETVKIDVFTREAPNLEKFIRILSADLPKAADAGLRGLDHLTAFVGAEIPRARQAMVDFGPPVQRFVVDKLHLAGDIASNVFAPALRGAGNVLRELIPQAEGAGQAVDGVFRAGIDAAAKVAREFETNSNSLGHSVGEMAGSVGHAAHEALPALKAGLSGAASAATVLVTSISGATAILAPFAGDALLAAGAIKGTQLAITGFGAAQGTIGKITTAWGAMADKASFAAGTVTQRLGTALGKDLNTAGEAGGRAMTRARSAFTALGGVLPVVGAGLLAVGYAHEQAAQQAQHNADESERLYTTLRQGGQAASEAQTSINTLNTAFATMQARGGLVAKVGQQLAGSMDVGKAASDRAYASLSILDQRAADVIRTQNDLSQAVQQFGSNSAQADAAATAYRGALAAQKVAQDAVTAATQGSASALINLTAQIDAAANASLSLKQSELAVQQQTATTTAAQHALNQAVTSYGAKSPQARAASLALAQAQVTLQQNLISAAQAASRAAQANDRSGDAAIAAKAGAQAYRAELVRLAGSLSPGSPVRTYLQGLINQLNSVPSSHTTVFRFVTDTTQYRPPPGGPAVAGVRAAGGPVKAGMPYVVGEHRPELFVPKTDGTIIPRVPAMAGAGRGLGGGNTYNINVQVAPGVHPADAGAAVVQAIREYEKRSGNGWRS